MSSQPAKRWDHTWQHTQTGARVQPERKTRVKVKVHKKRWVTTGEKVIYSLVSTAVLSALFYTVSFSNATDSLNREVQALENKVAVQEEINMNLDYKVKELSNPDRILDIARSNGLEIQNTKLKQANQISN